MILSTSGAGKDPRAADALASLVRPRPAAEGTARVPLPPASRVSERLRMFVRRPRPGVVVVALSGDVDMVSVPRLAELVRQRLTAAELHRVILDLSEVSFLSCGGLELLLHTERRAEQRGVVLDLVTGSRCVDRLLEISGTRGRLRCHANVSDALAA